MDLCLPVVRELKGGDLRRDDLGTVATSPRSLPATVCGLRDWRRAVVRPIQGEHQATAAPILKPYRAPAWWYDASS